MTTIRTFRRALTVGGLALALLAGGCASLAPSNVPTAWTGVSHPLSLDQTTGKFRREGVALFKNGEVAPFTVDGQFTTKDGSTFNTTITYRFDDGSTLIQEGSGQAKPDGSGRPGSVGTGRFTGGTGRFAGITGTTSSTSRNLSPTAQVTEFRAEATLPSK